jgi:sugar diacid utilization regulator
LGKSFLVLGGCRMNSFRCFLDDLCLNTGIKFNFKEEDGLQIYTGLSEETSETISFNMELDGRKVDICIPKKQKSNINLLKYIIINKYKEICFIKEQIIQDLLSGKEVGTDKIEKNLWFLEKYITVFLVNTEGSQIEALEIVRQLYLEQEVTSFIYGDNIFIIGVFEDIKDHAKSIKESIEEHLYCKCYVSLGNTVDNVNQIAKAYEEAKESMMLGKKFCFRDEVFSYDKMLFEKIVHNIDNSVKQELMNKFKTKFDVFDNELIETIQQFVNCGLNISNTSRMLYIHRNTLIYRLDKIKKETGFDIRKFTDATVFIISFFIWKGNYK